MERAGYEVEIVKGDYRNIKITTKEDLPMENRIGTGFDVHAFSEGRDLILGGVRIPFEKGSRDIRTLMFLLTPLWTPYWERRLWET